MIMYRLPLFCNVFCHRVRTYNLFKPPILLRPKVLSMSKNIFISSVQTNGIKYRHIGGMKEGGGNLQILRLIS